jgi:hypothetical protein
VIKKEVEKFFNTKSLNRNKVPLEYKTKVLPIIRDSAGTFSKSFRKYLKSVLRKHDIKALQKTVILGTAHVLWKVLM